MKSINVLFIFLFLAFITTAQNTVNQEINYKDIVKLKDGSEFIGAIKAIDDATVTMVILGGHEVKIPRAAIKNIKQKCSNCNISFRLSEEKNKKYYYQFNTGTITGNDNIGGSFTNSFGYHLSSKLGVGIGVGVQSFGDYWDRINTIPVFLEGKYFFAKNAVTPFCQVQGGYGIAKLNDNAKGGLYFQPSIGVAFRKNELLDFNVSVGFLAQKMTYHYPTNADFIYYNYIAHRDLSLRRWVIQGGVSF
jgi:hypothetical protein